MEKNAFAFHLATVTADIRLARRTLGPPQAHDFAGGLGDADYWAFMYPCGMKLLFELILPHTEDVDTFANVYGDLPEFEHARRHIPFPRDAIALSNTDINRPEIDYLARIEPWATLMSEPHGFQVWRQGDDGNVMPVGDPTSRRDALCWLHELESHGHKQLFWYTPGALERESPNSST